MTSEASNIAGKSAEEASSLGQGDSSSDLERSAAAHEGVFNYGFSQGGIASDERIALGRSSLNRRLIRVQRDVLKMGALVENSCLLAKEALCNRDLEAAKKIPIQDKQIDMLYRQIEVDCTNLLSLEAPVTQDLRLVSAFMQMVRDLERIGDYNKSIGSAAIKLFPHPVHECMGEIGTMLDRSRSMVALCLRSLSELDPDAGRNIKLKDDLVDDDYERLYNRLVNTQCTTGESVEPIVLMVLIIRSLERIADHATNVGKRVSYVVTGERT
ncbi:MAG: phosphate signaling complex protein PhoU [Phormidesmis sp. RL_2_1]|nr:phosphate signaling complex protein PhoU [Phormidesmis sp. RL_2_1]